MSSPETSRALLRASVSTLAPLVRRMISAGVRFGELERELRACFVRVAEEEEFRIPGKEQTHSRVSLLTGINRPEVRRIRSSEASHSAPKSFTRDVATELVNRWRTRHADRSGRPRPLPYRAKRGPSFSALARSVTNDLRPRILLEGLIASGVAELRDGGLVALRREAYVPTNDAPAKLAMLAEDPPELVATMLHNVFGAGPPRLQRKVAYDHLGADAADAIRAEVRRRGERFLRQVNRWLARFDRDLDPRAPGGERFYAGIGVYYFEEPRKPTQARSARRPKSRRQR